MIGIVDLGTVDSTSREASRRAAYGDIGPVWLTATAQTAGKGRSGREWASPDGNLYATLLTPFEASPAEAALRSYVAALAVARVIDTLLNTPVRVTLKWPNDVLVDDRKIAGILLESGIHGARRWLSVGIGINLTSAPPEARWPAIALAELIPPPNAKDTLHLLRDAYAAEDTRLADKGFAATRTAWLARAARLGQVIEARLPNVTHRGVFDGIDGQGMLLMSTESGPLRIAAADVHFDIQAEAENAARD